MGPWLTRAHEKDARRMLLFAGVGIRIAVGIEIAVDGHLDIDVDCDPDTDTDPGVSRYQPYFRKRLPDL